MNEIPDDGGPAFPVLERGANGLELTCPGMSKRELFAAILMHSEAVTCGVPGEACDALVEASRAAGTDVIDHMAGNAVDGADALLRALAAPKPVEYRELYVDEQARLDSAARLAAAVGDLQQRPEYAALPKEAREPLEAALLSYTDADLPF